MVAGESSVGYLTSATVPAAIFREVGERAHFICLLREPVARIQVRVQEWRRAVTALFGT